MKYIFKIVVLNLLLIGNWCFADYKYSLSIGAIFQNEAPYLKEWIEYHKLLGVEHFYLFNNHSTDNFLEILKPYIADGTVDLKDELTDAKNMKTFYPMQCKCYTDCAINARGESKWIAFIDIDEFLLPIKDESLPDFLKQYEEFGGVAVNWWIFGTSYVKKIPDDKLLIESLTMCTHKTYVDNRFVKCIVRPERVKQFDNAHLATFNDGFFGVNTDKFPMEGDRSDYVAVNKIRINHYWTRDEHFFYNVKMARYRKWGEKTNAEAIFQKFNAQKDDLILRYVPKLREKMIGKP